MVNKGERNLRKGPQETAPSRLPPPISVFTIVDYTDETTANGRPLMEGAATDVALERADKTGIDMSTVVCLYPGSRHGGQMNIAAFTEIADHLDEAWNDLAWINEQYFHGTHPSEVKVSELLEMAIVAYAMPSFAFNKASRPFRRYRHLPNNIGNIFKISRGIRGVTRSGISNKLFTPDTIADPENIYQTANDHGSLGQVQKDSQVCPAPQGTIMQALTVLTHQTDADPAKSPLERDFPDFDALKTFSAPFNMAERLSHNFNKRVIEINQSIREILTRDMSRSSLWRVMDLLEEFAGLEADHLGELTQPQIDMNRALGRQHVGIAPPRSAEFAQATSYSTPYDIAESHGVPRDAVRRIKRSYL